MIAAAYRPASRRLPGRVQPCDRPIQVAADLADLFLAPDQPGQRITQQRPPAVPTVPAPPRAAPSVAPAAYAPKANPAAPAASRSSANSSAPRLNSTRYRRLDG